MSPPTLGARAARPPGGRALLALFVASGAAALIYEVVWYQLLELVIGSTAVSLGIVLATFMGGMCVGSLLLPRIVTPGRHPLRVYAALELGTAITGAGVLWVLPAASRVFDLFGRPGASDLPARALLAAVILLPPTILMGATLPAVARWVRATPAGVSWLGRFYAGNIAGAFIGALLAGLVLLPFLDMPTATGVAVLLNLATSAVAFRLAAIQPHMPDAPSRPVSRTPVARAIAPLVAIALSGAAALGAEALWTRSLALLFGPTVYAFSIILAVVLLGLGIGSTVAARLGVVQRHPARALGFVQLAVAAAVAWGGWVVMRVLPQLVTDPASLDRVLWRDFVRALMALLPATVLWGASFPLALAASVRDAGEDAGRLVGRVYAANTLGAIVGALAFSIWLVPALGSRGSQQVLVMLGALAGIIMLGAGGGGWRAHRAAGEWTAAAGALLVVAVAFLVVPGVPTRLVAFGRNAWRVQEMPRTLYVGEGRNASIAVLERADGVRSFHVSGKVEASSEPQDMRLQRLLAHLGALVHPHPRSILVVGFGAGVTAGTFLMHPDVERIVVCEIEPLIPGHVGPLFARENLGVLDDPRVQIVYDDARHFLRTTTERFDVITSDPIHPWVKGAASLYTAEYFRLLRERLAPGGIITNWLPLYETSEEAARSAIGTFLEAVPNGTVWNTRSVSGRGFDAILLGQEDPTVIDVPALQRRLIRPEYQAVLHSLVTLGYGSPLDLFANFLGTRETLAPWLATAQINRDRNLRLQFLAGRAAWGMEQEDIVRSMSTRRVLPPGLFSADTAWLRALRDTLTAAPR